MYITGAVFFGGCFFFPHSTRWHFCQISRSHPWCINKNGLPQHRRGKVQARPQPRAPGRWKKKTPTRVLKEKIVLRMILQVSFSTPPKNLTCSKPEMGVSKNRGVFPPQIIHLFRVFHDFHHPFWGCFPIFLETPRCIQRLEQFFFPKSVPMSQAFTFLTSSLKTPSFSKQPLFFKWMLYVWRFSCSQYRDYL